MKGFKGYTRLSEALEAVISRVRRVGGELVRFDRALGRVLAQDVFSKTDVPPFDRAAVDGYAVRSADTFGASPESPARLKLVGAVEAGETFKRKVREGEAVKIMTGAPMPRGTNAVVMVEHVKREGQRVEVFNPVTPGKNVSRRGEDVGAGDLVLRRGQTLRPQDLGMLASTFNLEVKVARRPKVAIFSTGSELQEPGEKLAQAQVTDVNSYTLAAAVEGCGGIPVRMEVVPDELRLLKQALRRATRYELVVASGASSVGERDLLPELVAEEGELIFHGVAIRPGGPTAFGVVNEKPVFCLAGFPVASLVAFDMLVRPALRFMQGLPADRGYPQVEAKLDRKISSSLGRVDVVRVRLEHRRGELRAEPIRITGSSVLSSMAKAHGFVVVDEELEGIRAGAVVKVELYQPWGEVNVRVP